MLETALANVRFGSSMVLGRPFHRRSLDRILEAVRATHEEFGAIGVGADELLGGPTLDEETRKVMQGRRFRAQATRAAGETRYYRSLFESAGIDPSSLRYDDIARLPVTPKEALRDDGEAFVRSGARPAYRSTTTGTTGWPTTVWFSDDENHLIGALSTITFLGQRIIQPEDFVQISISTQGAPGCTRRRVLGQRHRRGGAPGRVGERGAHPGIADRAALPARQEVPGERHVHLSVVPG
jgi:phenylacetate-CoA ligase